MTPPHLILDAGPLGLVTNPRGAGEASDCCAWLEAHLETGAQVFVSEITDYEVRRELLRADKTKGIARLDEFIGDVSYAALSTPVMREAAELWAKARRWGKQHAPDASLDCDIILSAHARHIETELGTRPIVVTSNLGHLSLFCDARLWKDIPPE